VSEDAIRAARAATTRVPEAAAAKLAAAGKLHPRERIALLLDQGLIPKGLQTALVTREAYANGNAYLTLTTAGQRLWDDGWVRFQAG